MQKQKALKSFSYKQSLKGAKMGDLWYNFEGTLFVRYFERGGG